MQIGGHNKKGKEEYRYDGSHVVSFERIGVIPILVFLVGLAVTHIMIQDRVAHSKLGSALYRASVEYFFLVGTLQMCEDTDWAHHKQNGRNIFPPPNYHINANSNNAQYGMYVPLMQRANSVYEKSTREGANNTQLASF
eukprot:2078339-Rhodomonas_salina.5